jgi:hypothetical protein
MAKALGRQNRHAERMRSMDGRPQSAITSFVFKKNIPY